MELNALFRLMDSRVLVGMNVHNVNHLHEDHEGQLVSGAIMSKIGSISYLTPLSSMP